MRGKRLDISLYIACLRSAWRQAQLRALRAAAAATAARDRWASWIDETICADYARTNLCRAAEIEKAMADHAAEIAADPAQRMRWQSSAGVDPETAPFVLRTIRQDYGSAESYLEAEYGLTPARLMRLRRMYLE